MPRRANTGGGPPEPSGETEDGSEDDDELDDDELDHEDDPADDAALDIGEVIPGTLAELLDALAAGIDDATRRPTAAGVDYLVRDRLFARMSGDQARFRLRPQIAAAASRTPDAATAADGPDWVSFAPAGLDRYGADRATAWFELAHRLAGEVARAN